jgi:dCMP deaminase
MNIWDARWMDLASLVATWSKDRSRKTGAVVVDQRNVVVALGWNGFPRGVDDEVERRHARPAKYQWTEHAERNALYNAAANGISTRGCRLYIPWYPCADCARGIIQSGISEVIAFEPDWNDPTYAADFATVREMFEEVGTYVRFVPGEAPLRATL